MLPATPTAVRPGPVCLVAGDGRDLTERAAELRAAGRAVHVLDGVSDDALSPDFRVPSLHASPLDESDRVCAALRHLHAEHRLGAIEFPVRGGLGFRVVQAKAAGLAFDDVTLVARLGGCGAWDREREHRWPNGFAEVELDFAERGSFEMADIRLAPDEVVLGHVRKLGWGGEVDEAPLTRLEDSPTSPRSRGARCCPRPTPFASRDAQVLHLAPRERGEVAASLRAAGEGSSSPAPLVTVGIAHFNLGRYLPETLTSLAAQTYPHVEVIAIDDGSTDAESVAVFAELEARYPQWRFLRQANAGIGATRNRCLAEARGAFFIPVDADNVCRPDMIAAFARGLVRNPQFAAMTCYFLGFEEPGEFLYACRPAGGPHTLAAIRNVYGDANAVFRTEVFREVGGYETDRGTSCEDWEAFVKLAHAGHRIGVVPEHLFEYRHRPGGFSRTTNWYANHQRVLRQFTQGGVLPPGEAAVLWTALLGFHQELERREATRPSLRHRVRAALKRVRGWARRVPSRFTS